jgi:hypothetical protein
MTKEKLLLSISAITAVFSMYGTIVSRESECTTVGKRVGNYDICINESGFQVYTDHGYEVIEEDQGHRIYGPRAFPDHVEYWFADGMNIYLRCYRIESKTRVTIASLRIGPELLATYGNRS